MSRAGLSGLCLALALLSVPGGGGSALAQSASAAKVQLSTQVSAERVAVGDTFVVQVTALSAEGETPSEPRLQIRGDAEVNGPNVRTELRMFSDGSSFTRQRGLTATWTVTPRKVGKLVVGPGTFQAGGRTVRGEQLSVEVVPAGSAPPPPRGRRFTPPGFPPDPFGPDPFDFFRRRATPGFGDSPFGEDLAPVPRELEMERAPDPIAFLRQEATPRRVVIGEQVMLRVYVYGGRGPFAANFVAQPTTPDFLSFPLEQDDVVPHRVPIGDTTFFAAKVREIALFPLHAGELTIGGAELTLSGRGYPAKKKTGYPAVAPPLTITVVEPPLKGRPPGYVLGDVGSYLLSAEVEPRSLEQGGMVAVTAQLKGVGNVPSHITPPEQNGVEWLEPSVRGEVEPKGTHVGGSRTFRWTVRIDKAGDVDLGRLSLPYFDPTTDRYEVARAELGKLSVKARAPSPGAREPQAAEADRDAQPTSIAPRSAPSPRTGAPRPLTDQPGFLWALILLPLSVPALGGFSRGARALLALSRRGRKSGASRVTSLLARAGRDVATNPSQAASDFERALYEAIEVGAGLKARGVLRADLVRALTRAGLDEASSLEVKSCIDELEAFRFTGDGDLTALGARVTRVARSLAVRKPSRSRAPAAEREA